MCSFLHLSNSNLLLACSYSYLDFSRPRSVLHIEDTVLIWGWKVHSSSKCFFRSSLCRVSYSVFPILSITKRSSWVSWLSEDRTMSILLFTKRSFARYTILLRYLEANCRVCCSWRGLTKWVGLSETLLLSSTGFEFCDTNRFL